MFSRFFNNVSESICFSRNGISNPNCQFCTSNYRKVRSRKTLHFSAVSSVLIYPESVVIISYLRSIVRLRYRKSISGHNFQTIRKLANTEFQYHIGVIYRIYRYILTKNVLFPHERKFTLIYGPNYFPFWPYFYGKFCPFLNACSILELMRCNSNLTMLDILTLLSSYCRA